MARIKLSKRPKKFSAGLLKNPKLGIKKSKSREYLLNEDNVARGILECLNNNDPEGVMEIIQIYLETLNKSKLFKEANLPRSTVYTAFKNKNPTIKTLAKLMHAGHST